VTRQAALFPTPSTGGSAAALSGQRDSGGSYAEPLGNADLLGLLSVAKLTGGSDE
jgi:hypothetical protein